MIRVHAVQVRSIRNVTENNMNYTIYPEEEYKAIEEIKKELIKPSYKRWESWFAFIAAVTGVITVILMLRS